MRKSSTYKDHSTPGEIAFIIELILRPNKFTDNILPCGTLKIYLGQSATKTRQARCCDNTVQTVHSTIIDNLEEITCEYYYY